MSNIVLTQKNLHHMKILITSYFSASVKDVINLCVVSPHSGFAFISLFSFSWGANFETPLSTYESDWANFDSISADSL